MSLSTGKKWRWKKMERPSKILAVGIALALLSITAISFYSQNNALVNGQTAPAAKTPIKHIVFLIQENHAFDNFFGTFPNLPRNYSLDLNTCMPVEPPKA